MQRRAFGTTGLEVAPLGVGAARVSGPDANPQAAAGVLRLLLDAGANLVDTAQVYPGHEEFLGRTISQRRDEFVLVSKCGHHDVLPDGSLRSRPIGEADIDQALRRLKTDRLDVMLLHSYDRDLLERGEAVEVLRRARWAGKVRFIGYSGDNETAAYAAGIEDLDVIETSVSLADQANIDRVLPVAGRNGVGVIAKRPIANAAWRWMEEPAACPDANVRPYAERLAAMGLGPADLGLAGPAGRAWAELALRFTISQPGVHSAIVSTSRPEHARANVRAAAGGPLPRSSVEAVRRAFREAEAASGEPWPGRN